MDILLKLVKEYNIARKTSIIMKRSQTLESFHIFLKGGCVRSEAAYQNKLIKKLEVLFPGCHIQKNDPTENQGIPDILILFKKHWSMLEIKLSSVSDRQPNQDYYIDKFNDMSFAAFINPQNEEQVLYDLQQSFGVNR